MNKFLYSNEINQDNKLIKSILLFFSILIFSLNTFIHVNNMILRITFVIYLTFFIFLLFGKEKNIIRIIGAILTIGIFSYSIFEYSNISINGGYINKFDTIIAFIGVSIVVICGFKVNKNLTLLSLFFLSYLFWGKYIGGPLSHNGFSIKRILSYIYWGTQGIFGIGIGVGVSYVFLFILFGSFLQHSGFSDFINKFAQALVGKKIGGTAKVAVIASGLMGMINGSAIANVVTTGTITIPIMKKNGYSKDFAAAVEATASTGGQFCPPIMGATAFMMAEFLQVPYVEVMIAAIVPAFLYYMSIFLSVHLEAKKLNLKPIEKKVNIKEILKSEGYLMTPIFVLLILMFIGNTPLMSVSIAMGFTILSTYLGDKKNHMGIKKIALALKEGAVSAIPIGISCALIGLIIATVNLSGLGFNFGDLILGFFKSGNSFIGFILVMIMSTILGMGVPGIAAYIIIVALSVPVMVKGGATPLAANLFCLIYACLSNITPPVAMSSYVASFIANSNMFKTSIIAMKLGVGGFILPFFFIKNNALLLQSNDILFTIRSITTATIGVSCIAIAFSGFLKRRLNYIERILFIICGLLLIDGGLYTDIIGIIGFIILFLLGD